MSARTRPRLVAGFVALLLVAFWVPPATAGPGEGDLVALINAERSARGLPTLATDGRLAEHARSHAATMAAAGSVFHTPDLGSAVGGWDRLGENVGRGSTAAVVHEAFMASPGHRGHMLGDFTHVGVGTHATDGDMLYVTVVFMRVPAGDDAPDTASPPTSSTTTPTAPAMASDTPAPAPTSSHNDAADDGAVDGTRAGGGGSIQAAGIVASAGDEARTTIADRLVRHAWRPFVR